MATIEIALRCLLPRGLLSSDPYVVVNGGQPAPLTHQGAVFVVPSGPYTVEVTPFRDLRGGDSWVRRHAITKTAGVIGEAEVVSLRFHPAPFQSYMHHGWIWRSPEILGDPAPAKAIPR